MTQRLSIDTLRVVRQKKARKSALRRYRIENGLTPQALARKLRIAMSTLRSYENGSRVVPAEFAVNVVEKRLGIHRAEIRPDLFVNAGR